MLRPMVCETLPIIWSCSVKTNTCCANWSKTIGTSNNKVSFKIVGCLQTWWLRNWTPQLFRKILVVDVHQAQQTDGFKALLKEKNTELVNVSPVCTGRVQPLDFSFNKPFKDVVRQQFEKHLEDNLQRYTEGKISAFEY